MGRHARHLQTRAASSFKRYNKFHEHNRRRKVVDETHKTDPVPGRLPALFRLQLVVHDQARERVDPANRHGRGRPI